MRPHRWIIGDSYAGFQSAIAAFLEEHRDREVLVIAASRGAADDAVATARPGGALGVHRLTLAQTAAVLSAATLAERGMKIANQLACEAVAARVAHEMRASGAWDYFGPVTGTPGFAHALAATLSELRLNGIDAAKLSGPPGADLATALRLYGEQLEAGSLADLAAIHEIACEAAGKHRLTGVPMLLLDIPLRSALVRNLAAALIRHSPAVSACTLDRDRESVEFLGSLLGAQPITTDGHTGTIARVRSALFEPSQPSDEPMDESIDYFSAPGEAIECVEIARRIIQAAEAGIAFDRMAVLLRAPEQYQPLLEEALRRANVPAYFSRGVLRPDPSGRAFLAILACARENCSASRFAEYLSLGQAPSPGQPRDEPALVDDELHTALRGGDATPPAAGEEPEPADDAAPVIEGSLQAPSHWEHLVIDACVIGGAERWQRRLDALGNELRLKVERTPDPAHYEAELSRLENLKSFALPLIERLGNLPRAARWGEWLPTLRELAHASLRKPASVLAVLDELEPMEDVGPAGLEEISLVLSKRLRFLRREPPVRRYGRVFVGAIEEARGRIFDAVFVPGLAEGIFPRRVAEDPMLLDAHRRNVSEDLITNTQRREHERLLLRIAVAAAARQFTFSYPRIELTQSRPRVPSFYALEAIRAAHGYLPELQQFQEQAAGRAPSRLDRLAPLAFEDAIDDAEYDLVALDRALPVKGRPQPGAMGYLTSVSQPLARSLRARYSRWEIRKWTAHDGLIDPALSELLQAYRLGARPYSPTALQAFAACPYRFALQGLLGLRPRDIIQPLNQMDPLTRGALFHDAQRRFYEKARVERLLPMNAVNVDACHAHLDSALNAVAENYEEKLAPAIARVWRAEIEDIRTDLHGWLHQIAGQSDWLPVHFELGFGLNHAEPRDPASSSEPVTLDGGEKLRGAIDLVERQAARGTLRVVDHKTGKPPERRPAIVGGGAWLQPLLYALAAEKILGAAAESGRLFFCTQRGNYEIVDVAVTPATRLRIGRALEIIDQAIASGNLPAAPNRDACRFCDCRPVCGPHEEVRRRRKTEPLDGLEELRNMP